MKIIIGLVAATVIITSAFAAGTTENFSSIQSKRAAQIDAQIN